MAAPITITAMTAFASRDIDTTGDLAPANAWLTAVGLACRRGDRVLFRGLDFVLRPGQIVWVRGSNGRGKTSLLRLVAGLSAPEDGEIHFGGVPLRRAGAEFQQQLLYLAHANALKDDLTAVEALGFLARLHGQTADRAALLRALDALALGQRRDAPVRTLSQGQRRRVCLARLALRPVKPLWVLDEPYDALDADGCALVDALLCAHAQQGGSVMLTSHLPLNIRQPLPLELVLPGVVA